jgi:3-hydroxyethyl bacteriochlorophyllide a dehydrogenase
MKAEAIIFPKANEVTYGPVELLEPEEGEALVRTLITVVSTGTDTRTLRGKQTGGRFPLVPGYSSLGVVEEVRGEAAVEAGDLVFAGGGKGFADVGSCWGAQCSRVVVPAGGLFPLDERRSPAEYGFMKVAAIALHGVRRSMTEPADRVLVIGLGLIGQLHARIQAATGRQVVAADILPWRVERAVAAGALRGVNAAEEDLAGVVAETWPEGPQAAVEATARQEGLDQCMALLRKRAWGGDDRMPVLVVQSSFVGRISFAYDAVFGAECLIVPTRDQDPRDLRGAAQMIGAGSLRVDDLITLRSKPQNAPAAFKELLDHPERHVTIVFEWE